MKLSASLPECSRRLTCLRRAGKSTLQHPLVCENSKLHVCGDKEVAEVL